MRDLTPFYRPRSIAVVGAGERATSSGGAVLQNLIRGGYTGRLVPVNPKGGTAFGLEMATSLQSLSEPVDLAVIVIRPDMIVAAARDAPRGAVPRPRPGPARPRCRHISVNGKGLRRSSWH